MEFTPALIKKYHQEKNRRHTFYADTVEMYQNLDIHFNGKYPTKLIEDRRPNESAEIKDYRIKLFKPITKGVTSAVYNALMKIYRSDEWGIRFDKSKVPSIIIEEETPNDYINEHLPYFGNLSAWGFNVLLPRMMYDPNAWVLTAPINPFKQDNEYFKPIPIIYSCEQVIDYELNEWVLLRSEEKSRYTYSGTIVEGAVYLLVDRMNITKYEQRNNSDGFIEAEVFPHNFGYVPCHPIGNLIEKNTVEAILFKSRIESMLPYLDEALREYNDLQAVVVQHSNPKFWMYEAQDCAKCRGVGTVKNSEGVSIKCATCGGRGSAPVNPFDITVVRPSTGDQQDTPTPPMGYVTLDQAFIETQDKRIANHVYSALSTINMQYLANTPLTQSGVAKEIDKDELKNFYFSYGEDIVRVLDLVTWDILNYRYGQMNVDLEELRPFIPVPTKLNTVTNGIIMEELKGMKSAGLNSEIVKSGYLALIENQYSNEPEQKMVLMEKINMDFLAGLSDDSINLSMQMNTVDRLDVVIHYNIGFLIDQAIALDKKYFDKPEIERYDILRGLAEKKVPQEKKTTPYLNGNV